jgi:ribosomal-protein-alanine N-acetyltransferase
MEFEVINTERLILRKLTPEVFAYLFENYADKEIKKYLGLTSDEALAIEKKKLKGGYVTYDRTILAFLLVLKENNETIGRCGFHNWYKEHYKAELGYAMSKDEYKRQGYMGEAVPTIIEYGFNTMNLNRIEACVGPTNIASLKIIRNNGFTQEGYLREHFIRDGEIQDTLIFSLLKAEYDTRS